MTGNARYTYRYYVRFYDGYYHIYLQVPTSVALERNGQRPHSARVPDTVIHSMAERLEAPKPSSNTWELFSLTTGEVADSLDMVEELVTAARKSPVLPLPDQEEEEARREADRSTCTSSVLHRVDGMVRGLVKARIAALRSAGASSTEVGGCRK